MVSVGQCSLGACLGLKKNINSFPIVQAGNARCLGLKKNINSFPIVQAGNARCLGLKKNINSFPIVQSANARCLGHLSTNQQKSSSTFSQISLWGKKKLNVSKRSKEDQWRIRCTSDGSCGIAPERLPSVILELVRKFYDAMNCKSTEESNQTLNEIISENCIFQDLIFYLPFGGRKNIVSFLGIVKDAMGPNVHVVLDSVLEGENLTATVIWHLKWEHNHKAHDIPFTTGYTFFDCEQVDGKFYISKINGVEELPVKPGDLVLKLFKAISSGFDSFPLAAEALLQKSQTSHEGLLTLLDRLSSYRRKGTDL